MRAFHCLRNRSRRGCRRFRWGRWRPWTWRWFRGFSKNLTHAKATVMESGIFLIQSRKTSSIEKFEKKRNGLGSIDSGNWGTNWGIWLAKWGFDVKI
jgi:hypothetical protein